ncbi:uncharacterized protein sun2 isoform X2 [Genypterus blacodes]|uniref:uncharacterized protein sun2 isoform X2 n=1 Tax=Genypterus blacodes TaxID=154954 RepID=UPI003F75F49D
MSRRSARLASDEESSDASVTNISYHERPVRVFKKVGNRRGALRRSSSNASSANTEPPDEHEAPSPSPLASQSKQTARTAPYTSPATPRPALNSRSQTPTPSQERDTRSDLNSSSRPSLPRTEPGQKHVDSSGYSSSEGSYRKPAAANADDSNVCSVSGVPSAGRSSSGDPRRGMASVSGMVAAVRSHSHAVYSQILCSAALALPSFSRLMKKALRLFLLPAVLLLSVWLLSLLLTPLLSRTGVMTTPQPAQVQSEPVPLAFAPPPPPPGAVQPAVDPAVVSAVVEEKLQHLMKELLVKQEELFTQMKERVQLDMQDLRTRLEAAGSDGRLRLEEEMARLSRQMADYQRGDQAAGTNLHLKVEAVEAQNAKLWQELLSVQLKPPTDPCPDPSPASLHDRLTPELQQAMEKWLGERIKEREQEFGDKGSHSDCARPIADKMADFALESQGASVVSTRCSETYRIRSACVTVFGFPLWYPSESPRTVIQGFPVLLPGKCWAFHGVQGTLVISLSHPVRMTHVTLDHLPHYNAPTGRIDSAPKDFEVYGMEHDSDEGVLLGKFTYDQDGESSQTFKLPNPSDAVYGAAELRILSNWGHMEYTCVYRFRVHGEIAST